MLVKKLKALIIDDELAILEELKWHLEQHGWDVTTAKDGIRGLEQWDSIGSQLDLVISDIRMPGVSGQSLVKNIATAKRDLLPALFIMTAYDDVLREDAHAIGADAIFQKPFRVMELISAAKHFVHVRNKFAADSAKALGVLNSNRDPKVQ